MLRIKKMGNFSKITACFLLFIQLFYVLFFSTAKVVADPDIPKKTSGIQSVIEQDRKNYHDTEKENYEETLASSVSQVGNILSSDNSKNAAINYTKNLGEKLVNKKVNDWLGQYGTARFFIDTDKNISGDFLLPVIDGHNSLLFTQFGIRNNTERNTANLGFGYRQYYKNWMCGINTFYDYDYTGRNSRLGIGGEAWTDYLKLAANSYFSLTNWHQSKISVMNNYIERPASGFDINAQAYLPAYPQLGGSIKYEQYFGKAVHLATGANPNELKKAPYSFTFGMNYTPIPLITLKVERSVGDVNNTMLGLDITYRFGVPLSQQLDHDSVGMMHSLVGNKYDFVDRNYDIVMEYRKQNIISISTPNAITEKAGKIITISATVNNAKYGLKDVRWEPSANFISDGGRYRKMSSSQVKLALPQYINKTKNNPPQEYQLTAVGIDNKGNESNKAITLIKVIPDRENAHENSTITLDKDIYPANSDIKVTVTLKDGKYNSITGKASELTSTNVVNVPNAKMKIGEKWKENEAGTYTTIYKAETVGEDLKATVKLPDWKGTTESANYAITTGNPAYMKSTITLDKTSYPANSDINVTVTLKDGKYNSITGKALELTSTNVVNVPNAKMKIGEKWKENEAGTYTTIYKAETVGEDLKATVKLPDWKGTTESANYAITTGNPAYMKSTITLDKTSYPANSDINVTVTLKDGKYNSITGKALELTSTNVVNVPNAKMKIGEKWKENEAGTYTTIYKAETVGEDLKATVKLPDWKGTTESANYAITTGNPAYMKSTITLDKTSYPANSDIKVTVTLKDGKYNSITGKALELTSTNVVNVPNAKMKIGEKWKENEAGTYTTIYKAETVGEDLKATVKLPDWKGTTESANYAITTGNPAYMKSTITLDKTSYPANSDINVTVTLKDGKYNSITGKALELTSTNVVNVPNAKMKIGEKWKENEAGTYTTIYKAETVGEDLKATVKLPDWKGTTESANYAITTGNPAYMKSTITLDKTSYPANSDINVTVTLKDLYGNRVTGKVAELTDAVVTVPNAKMKIGEKWKENEAGTYTTIYKAETVGEDLKATVKLPDWKGTTESANYAITTGNPAYMKSTITLDKTSYPANSDINVTVTLKDLYGNRVTGKVAELTDAVVTVPNAKMKIGEKWKENEAGTYTTIYKAETVGEDLKATVKLPDWKGTTESANYAITTGNPAYMKSTITLDKTSYPANSDINVTVTLKDLYGNRVTGKVAELTDAVVTVPNAKMKIGEKWKENEAGTYTTIYKAETVGEDLKATVKLPDWKGTTESANYAITTGNPAYMKSTITLDKTSYPANSDINVTVTLKDLYGNRVTGKVAELTDAVVTVPNAKMKIGEKWKENEAGTYTTIYKAETVGEDLKATVKLPDWKGTTESANYAITTGNPAYMKSTITLDKTSYPANSDINVTVTLKDLYGNRVTGKVAELTDAVVTVPNAKMKIGEKWKENEAGTYTTIYKAETVGEDLKATVKLPDWKGTTESANYAITTGNPAYMKSTITLDKTSYPANSDINVTVTLKDLYRNRVTGKVAELTDAVVTVPNAKMKIGEKWKENEAGTYTTIYKAETVGEDLKATVKLPDWKGTTESANYAITTGNPAYMKSTITLDKTSYPANSDINVTVTLKDLYGNRVTGKVAELTDAVVTVPNAKMKIGEKWKENEAGVYTRTYMAQKAQDGLKATLKLSAWHETVKSTDYAITVGYPASEKSTIQLDKTGYSVNSDMKLTVILKDKDGNSVTGKVTELTDAVVTVPNAVVKNEEKWKENEAGVYTRTYQAKKAALEDEMKAILKLRNWKNSIESELYYIVNDIIEHEPVGGNLFLEDDI